MSTLGQFLTISTQPWQATGEILRLIYLFMDSTFQPLQLVAQPLRHRFPGAHLKVWIIWAPFWWGTCNPEHPRPLLRGTNRILKDYFGGFENHDFNPAFPAWAQFKSRRMLSDAVSINRFDISSLVIGYCHFSPQWYWNWEILLNSGVRPSILVQSKVQTVWSAS